MQLLSADAAMVSKNFAPENMKKPPSKVAHNRPNFFFSISNRPKISPNLIFYSIKMSLCATFI